MARAAVPLDIDRGTFVNEEVLFLNHANALRGK
jgi:hypothetical protein